MMNMTNWIDSKSAMPVLGLGAIALVIVFVLLFTPSRQELFDECLGIAERAGLLEEAALV
jgi:hypothetical protein